MLELTIICVSSSLSRWISWGKEHDFLKKNLLYQTQGPIHNKHLLNDQEDVTNSEELRHQIQGISEKIRHRRYPRVWLPPLSQRAGFISLRISCVVEAPTFWSVTQCLGTWGEDPKDTAARTALWWAKRVFEGQKRLAHEAKAWKRCGRRQYNAGRRHWVTKWTTVTTTGLFNQKQHKHRLRKCNHPQRHLQIWRHVYWDRHAHSKSNTFRKRVENKEKNCWINYMRLGVGWSSVWLPLLRTRTCPLPSCT